MRGFLAMVGTPAVGNRVVAPHPCARPSAVVLMTSPMHSEVLTQREEDAQLRLDCAAFCAVLLPQR